MAAAAQLDPSAASTSNRVRVLCVEDNEIVADALRSRLGLEPGIEWAGWLASADDLVAAVEGERPDIILLDIDMPGRDPFEALQEALARSPHTRAVMFTGHVRKPLVDRAIAAGAWGYVSKEDGAQALVDAITRVLNGEFVFSPSVQALMRH
ncbi:MAG TPA: response regulator transcription factor [Phycisphaerales bacterium]|nr:response regulator transcription factor [Phycisphaerales bacterium]